MLLTGRSAKAGHVPCLLEKHGVSARTSRLSQRFLCVFLKDPQQEMLRWPIRSHWECVNCRIFIDLYKDVVVQRMLHGVREVDLLAFFAWRQRQVPLSSRPNTERKSTSPARSLRNGSGTQDSTDRWRQCYAGN